VVNLCAERKLPFVAGHALNCYNAVTLRLLQTGHDALVYAGGTVPRLAGQPAQPVRRAGYSRSV
jgi:hypothetical protein